MRLLWGWPWDQHLSFWGFLILMTVCFVNVLGFKTTLLVYLFSIYLGVVFASPNYRSDKERKNLCEE